ncbi:transmembrane protease serine 9-like [Paramacrobiotus metropolitanus]|uniref:transmembrane protease serine 9-like n=1 Tax=Paramacrobiotus metropolitanus TaxID=2943436 RepID=UPI0024459512|nr:transmembrane protease serine 9-like [Paramacrobiotus metropolitanus]
MFRKSGLCVLWCYALVSCFGGAISDDDYGPGSDDTVLSATGDMEFVDVGPAVPMSTDGAAADYPDTPAPAVFGSGAPAPDYPEPAPSPGNTQLQAGASDDYPDVTQSAVKAGGDYDTPVKAPDQYGDEVDVVDDSKNKNVVKIINGIVVPENEFNFIVSLRKDGHHNCGGYVLLDRKSIITAAHCVHRHGVIYPASILSVAVGTHKLSAVTAANIIQVSQVFVHPQWSENAILNDIAVLRLAGSISSTLRVTTVKLPPVDREPDVGRPLETAGWGRITPGPNERASSDVLLKATLKLVDRTVCSQKLSRPSRNPIPASQICTENDQAGTCQGDSGGPLINRLPGGDYLVGLTSYGPEGCILRTADAFTKVSHFIDWINNPANGPAQRPPPLRYPHPGVVSPESRDPHPAGATLADSRVPQPQGLLTVVAVVPWDAVLADSPWSSCCRMRRPAAASGCRAGDWG